MRRSLAVGWVLVSTFATGIPFLFGQAPNAAPTQGSVAPATSSTTATNPLAGQLKSPDEKVRIRAARDLGKSRDASAVPALSEALSDPSQKVRREVILALAQIHQPATLPPLIKATNDNDEGNRVLAVQSLVGYYTGVTPTSGVYGFFKKEVKRAESRSTPDSTQIDPGVPVDADVITALDATLKDTRSIQASREAAKGLGILLARAAVPDLVKAAHSSEKGLSLEALNALSKIKDRSAGGELIDLLDSPVKDIKQQACVAIGILRANQAVPKLQSIFETETDPKSKEMAMEGLAYVGDPVSSPTFTKGLSSDDKVIRASAAEGLARAADPKTLAELEKAVITEKDAGAKLAMEFAMTALGKFDYMNDIVNDLSTKTWGDVAQSYLIELARTPGFLSRLYPYLQSPNAGVRIRLCNVLMFSGDQTSLDQLDRLSHDPNGDVSAQALRAKSALRARLAAAGTTPPSGSH